MADFLCLWGFFFFGWGGVGMLRQTRRPNIVIISKTGCVQLSLLLLSLADLRYRCISKSLQGGGKKSCFFLFCLQLLIELSTTTRTTEEHGNTSLCENVCVSVWMYVCFCLFKGKQKTKRKTLSKSSWFKHSWKMFCISEPFQSGKRNPVIQMMPPLCSSLKNMARIFFFLHLIMWLWRHNKLEMWSTVRPLSLGILCTPGDKNLK